jgi:hypothetical protein
MEHLVKVLEGRGASGDGEVDYSRFGSLAEVDLRTDEVGLFPTTAKSEKGQQQTSANSRVMI